MNYMVQVKQRNLADFHDTDVGIVAAKTIM